MPPAGTRRRHEVIVLAVPRSPIRAFGRSVQLARHGVLRLQTSRLAAWGLSRFGESDVWLMFRRDLTKPVTPYAAKVPIDIDIARDGDMDEAAALYHHARPERVPRRARWFRRRIRDGSYCFVARIDGAIVAYNWIRVESAVGIHGEVMRLREDEIYMTDAFTAHAWREKGIHPALNYAMLRFAKDSGYRVSYSLLRADNLRSWITMPRVGWEHTGTLTFFRAERARDSALWYVAGSAHPMPLEHGLQRRAVANGDDDGARAAADRSAPPERETADLGDVIDRVRERFDFDHHEEIRRWPWARTYRLDAGERTAYLKLVSPRNAASLPAIERLAQRFPGTIPQVIACDREGSWQLTLDHGGAKLDHDSPEEHLLGLVETYARLQCACVDDSALLAGLPQADGSRLLTSLLDFLEPRDPSGADRPGTRAELFLGPRYAHRYHAALTHRRDLLERHMAAARSLPGTLNHGGLRPTNTALSPAGDCVLISWNEASRGPAGLSLHALFSGCLIPNRLLSGGASDAVRESRHGRLLQRYVETLLHGGYADERTLRRGLPASITIGVVQYLSSFAKYPPGDDEDRELIGRNLERRLGDLLDLCDRLSVKSRRTALEHAEDYRRAGNLRRSRCILKKFLESHPEDAFVWWRLGSLLAEHGRIGSAQKALRRATGLAPERAEPHHDLGLVLMRDLRFESATRSFERVLELDPTHPEARRQVERAILLQDSWTKIRALNAGGIREPS